MARHSVRLEDFPKILNGLPKEFNDAAIVGLRVSAHELKRYTVEEILGMGLVATGELSRSVKVHELPDGAEVEVEAPHAEFLERGTRPHMPPLQPLIDWVRMKGLATDEREVQRIARAVQRKIAREGTKPHFYFLNAVAIAQRNVVEHIVAEWSKL